MLKEAENTLEVEAANTFVVDAAYFCLCTPRSAWPLLELANTIVRGKKEYICVVEAAYMLLEEVAYMLVVEAAYMLVV